MTVTDSTRPNPVVIRRTGPDHPKEAPAMTDTPRAELVATIRRLLADSEDARKALQRAESRYRRIGDELLEIRSATDPTEWRAAYKEAQQ